MGFTTVRTVSFLPPLDYTSLYKALNYQAWTLSISYCPVPGGSQLMHLHSLLWTKGFKCAFWGLQKL